MNATSSASACVRPARRRAISAALCPAVLLALMVVAGAGCARERPPSDDGTSFDATTRDGTLDLPTTAPDAAPPGQPAGAGLDVTRIDPCALLTREEAEAVVQVALNEPQPSNVGSGHPSCTYPGSPAGPVAKVDVLVGEGAETLLMTDRRLNEQNPDAFAAIEDLGDEAYLRHTTVYFRLGDVWAVVAAVRIVDAALLRDPLIAAARAAASRLEADAER